MFVLSFFSPSRHWLRQRRQAGIPLPEDNNHISKQGEHSGLDEEVETVTVEASPEVNTQEELC